MKLLTAAEMAQLIRCSVKTFNRRVKEYGLPFIDSGQPLYNPDKVLPMLEQVRGAKSQPAPVKADLTLPSKKYRKMLGL